MLKKSLPVIREDGEPPVKLNENRQFIKDEIKLLFTRYSSYPSKLRSLASELADYITYYLLDDKCIDNRRSGNYGDSVKDKICKISNVYTPLNNNLDDKGKLVKDGKVLASGQNARIYSNIFRGENIVTKAPLTWDIDYIIENFISYRVINTILANNILVNNLLPSYSLFTCRTNLPETKVDPSFSLEICSESLKNKHPVMFITQKQLTGKTLALYLVMNELTFDDLQYYIREIAITLISLEESPYQISHNDLHCANIIIEGRSEASRGHPVIIDWGHGRFINPKTGQIYQSFIYDDYETSIFSSRLKIPHTGAYDFFFLITAIMFNTRNKRNSEETKIFTFLEEKVKSLMATNFMNSYGKPVVFDYSQFYLLRFLQEQERCSIEAHEGNLKKLGELTYRKLFSEWLTEKDNRILSDNKTKLNSPDFFKIESNVQSDDALSGVKLDDSSSQDASSSEQASSSEEASSDDSSSQELSLKQPISKEREKICSYSNRYSNITCDITAEMGSEFCYYHNQKRLIYEMKDDPEKICSYFNKYLNVICKKHAKIGSDLCRYHLFKKVTEEKEKMDRGSPSSTSSSEEEPSPKKPPVRKPKKICLCINALKKARCINESEKDSEFCWIHKDCRNIYSSKNLPVTNPPSANPPKASSSKQPSANPPKASSSKPPSANPPKASSSKPPSAKPPKASSSKQPSAKPPKASSSKQPSDKPPKASSSKPPSAKPPKASSTKPSKTKM